MLPFLLRDAQVAIVDDDPGVRDSLALLLRVEGIASECFASGDAFLDALQLATPDCVILDLQLPGSSGLGVLRRLAERKFAPPVVVVSGQPDVLMAVEAMKLGAMDYLVKPFAAAVLVELVRDALAVSHRATSPTAGGLADFPGRARLTRRECDVLDQVAQGASNKEAGRRLGISPRTIEVHRARIMDKLGAKNAADLMRIVLSDLPARAKLRAV